MRGYPHLADKGHPHLANGGYPNLTDRGIPPSGWPGQYPHLADGVTPGYSLSELDGVPLLGLDRGTPIGTGWGYPQSELDGILHICLDWMGAPPSGLDRVPPSILGLAGGTPDLPIRRQSSRANTRYAAGSMPLAFAQEDFLVKHVFALQKKGFIRLPKAEFCY